MRTIRRPILAAVLAAAPLLAASAPVSRALAVEGQPASPSGAPAAAAEQGSSMAGNDASKNEMKSHDENVSKQREQVNPHKTAH